MQGGPMVVEGPVRLASVLTPSKPSFLPSLTKIVGTLGPNSRSVEVIEACLEAGMSVARFDFSWLDDNYHQETLENLRIAVKNVKRLCAVMLDTMGPALQVCNKTGNPIEMKADNHVTITPDTTIEPSAEVLPVNYTGLAKTVKKEDTIFVGQYLFTGIETTSVWLEVLEIRGPDIICLIKNSASLVGSVFTMHVSQVHIDLPTLTGVDRQAISNWGTRNKVDFISLSYTRHVEDVRELRAFIKAHNLHETQIFAKIETVEGLRHFDEILQEADGVILSRGNLGIDLAPEKSVEVIEACLEAGMSVARFDFSWLDDNYHQETMENLRTAVKNVKRLCAVSVLEISPEDSCLDLCSFVSQPSCFTWRFRKCHVKVLVVFVCESCLFLLAILKIL